LKTYLRQAAGRSFHYGEFDCFIFILLWLDVVTDQNGQALWRGRYSDLKTCRDFISANGGMQAIARHFLQTTYGLKKAKPRLGNIVIASLNKRKAFGIRAGSAGEIAVLTQRGLLITKRAAVHYEWGCPCHF
jgi:hypothetical protein